MTLLYPGSFDPVTLGHIDIAVRGAKIAERVIVALLHNPHKAGTFTMEERIAFLQEAFRDIPNIEVGHYDGMLVDYVKSTGATAILRGVRSITDFETETRNAIYNKMLSETFGSYETLLLPANPAYAHVSSTAIREMASFIYKNNLSPAPLGNMVTPNIQEVLKARFQGQ